jgi:Rrf2 family protein
MMTREADYAMRAVVFLASVGGADACSCADVAHQAEIPYRFLRKIVSKLVSAGILQSQRGRRGGLTLQRPADGISLLDVIRAVDPNAATLNTCMAAAGACSRQGTCRTRSRLVSVQEVIDRHLADISMDKLI